MLISAVWACFVDFSHVIWPPPLSDHLVLSLSGELTVQSNLVNMDTEAASVLSRDGTRIFQSGFSDSHVRSNWGPKHFGWVPKSWWPSPEKFRFVVVMRKSDCQITVILITRPVQSIKQQTNVAEAHWSFLDVLIVSSLLCVVKSNMAATMWICFVRNFFYMSLKQQNLFKIQSKWSEFFKSISYTLGRIKILMIHFLHFVCIKMRDFCVNAISFKWVEFRENV